MRHLRYIFVILILSFILSPVVFAEDLSNTTSEIVGIVKDEEPTWYAIVTIDGKKKKLYTKGDIFYSAFGLTRCLRIEDIKKDTLILKDVNSQKIFTVSPGSRIPLEETDIIFERSVKSEVLEYRYKDSMGAMDDFRVKNLDRKKIVLEKDYDKSALSGNLSGKGKEIFESPQASDDSKKIKAELFENIEINKIGEDTWAFDRENARKAISNTEQTLDSVIKSVRPQFRFGEGPSLKFNCELGDIVLNREGFLIQNLAVAKLAERSGIKQGDLIKTVNRQPVNSLYGVFKAVMDIKSNSSTKVVNVDLVRDGKFKTLTYKIK